MKAQKKRVGIIFGGMSAEHEVSIESAKAVVKNMDKERFTPLLIYIGKAGKWCLPAETDLLKAGSYQQSTIFQEKMKKGCPFHGFAPWEGRPSKSIHCDIYFPVLHGPNGEDGKIQSLLELSGFPFVGAGSMSSALAMNKAVAKSLFKRDGLPTADFLEFTAPPYPAIESAVSRDLRLPVFVKPCSLGSSVGISKVNDWSQLKPAVNLAFRHDHHIIIEQAIDAREIEISVMGNREVQVSRPGELIPHNEFYDYADKYLENKTQFNIPARLGEKQTAELREMAEKAYRALYLNGMARIDFLVEKRSKRVFLNEINTIPGFTEISMFPKLWELEGISFTELINRLIDYGFEHHNNRLQRL